MSGRSGYRKTTAKRSPPRPMLVRLAELNDRASRKFPSAWKVRLGFLLPKEIAAFVADGNHGIGVNVIRGFVQVQNGSAEGCFVAAAEFLGVIAKGRPWFRAMCAIKSIDHPDRSYGRWIVVVNGAMAVCAGLNEPVVYQGRAV